MSCLKIPVHGPAGKKALVFYRGVAATFSIPPELDFLKMLSPAKRLKTPENFPIFRNRKISRRYRAFSIFVFSGDFFSKIRLSGGVLTPDFVTKINTETADRGRWEIRPAGPFLNHHPRKAIPSLTRLPRWGAPLYALLFWG